ncbi:MAG TPA: hypothetical protein VJN89_13745 [Candidatus Acidoferrum sp.]|nr:hypothetical protein [Candidatus Acidoferrum sp.]
MLSVQKLGFLVAMIAVPLTLNAQVIRIRVINASNGRPMQRQNVSLTLLYTKDQKAPPKYDANLRSETDASGETQFHLPEPAPVHFSVKVRLTSEYWHCMCLVIGDTQDLIQKGLVQPASNNPAAPDTKPKREPGVVLFLARPFTFFERLLYPLMKE